MPSRLKTSTRNEYSYPVDRVSIRRISHTESDAHVGPLKFSVDFIVPAGTRVKAALGGRVVDAKADGKVGGSLRRFEKHGNFLEILHENGEYSEYEHLSRLVVKPGDLVRRGQLIGYSGATGYLAGLGAHLHFMVGVYRDYHTLRIRWR